MPKERPWIVARWFVAWVVMFLEEVARREAALTFKQRAVLLKAAGIVRAVYA